MQFYWLTCLTKDSEVHRDFELVVIVLMLYSQAKQCFSPPTYKYKWLYILANCWDNLTKCWYLLQNIHVIVRVDFHHSRTYICIYLAGYMYTASLRFPSSQPLNQTRECFFFLMPTLFNKPLALHFSLTTFFTKHFRGMKQSLSGWIMLKLLQEIS